RYRDGALLWALRVKPAWRNRGVGKRLIASGMRVARHAKRRWVEIEVELGNARARGLYERLGFDWVRRGVAGDGLTGAMLDVQLDTLRCVLPESRMYSHQE